MSVSFLSPDTLVNIPPSIDWISSRKQNATCGSLRLPGTAI